MILLGAALADLLLPSGARQLLAESLASLGEDEGLRLRLTLDPALSEYPWEALWVARQQGLKDATGFLALDPRVSIVRDLPAQGPLPDGAPAVGDRRVVAALSDPVIPGRARLQLDAERLNLEEAFRDVPGMTVDVLPQPTADSLADRLADGADVFHYVGHGMPGALAFVGPNEAVALLPATQLAINLRARGVQLGAPDRLRFGRPARAGRVGLGRDRPRRCRGPGRDRDAVQGRGRHRHPVRPSLLSGTGGRAVGR